MVGNPPKLTAKLDVGLDVICRKVRQTKLTAQAQITKFYPGNDPTKHVDLCQKEWKRLGYHDERTWPHLFSTTLDDLPNKWYKLEEARGDTFTWKTLRKIFIKEFSFTPDNEKLKPSTKQFQQFIRENSSK